jgi:hypothetical protein
LPIRRGHARVLFNEGAFAEDTMGSGRAGAEALREARGQFEREGVEIKALRRCEAEGRDGTRLPACFKVYLPAPNGKFGMVFRFIQTVYEIARRVSTASCHRSVFPAELLIRRSLVRTQPGR